MKYLLTMAAICFLAVFINIPALHPAGSSSYKAPEIVIPYSETAPLDQIVTGVENAPDKLLWDKFTSENGNWNIILSRTTGTPVAAFGKGIQITEITEINENNIRSAADSFIKKYSNVLGSNNSDLKFISSRQIDGHWYVSYSQSTGGMDIINSRLDLRIFKNGKVSAFFSKLYPDVKLQSGKLSAKQAEEISTKGLTLNNGNYKVECNSKQYILPIENFGSVIYVPVYQVYIRVYGEPRHYLAYIDADNGTILRRVNLITDLQTTGNLKGFIKMHNSLENDTLAAFYGSYINSGSNTIITEDDGSFGLNLLSNATYTFNFDSYYGKLISDYGKTLSKVYFQIIAGEENPLQLNDNNSHLIERTTFYHINKVHAFYKELDPNVEVADRKTYLSLYWHYSVDNAYSNFDSIVFLNAASTTMNLALTPEVVYHEYGHSYTNLLYKELSDNAISRLYNSTIHEGLADLSAALVSGSPKMGLGAFVGYPDSAFRVLDNTLRYPEGMHGESHYDGQIISGAYWDLWQAVSRDYVNHLVQRVKYGMPDDLNTGLAFYKFFVETLVADDDDGDLSNGTPHDEAIITSFDNHGIGMDLHAKLNFSHTQSARNIAVGTAYKADFTLNMLKIKSYEFKDISLVYSTDSWETKNKISASKVSDGKYTVTIPEQPDGTLISYYFEAVHPLSGASVKFASGVEDSSKYFYSVNYENAYHLSDDYQTWTVGAAEDAAFDGKWEWVIPNRISSYGSLIQPAGNSKGEEDYCFMTGVCKDSSGINMLYGFPDGTTSIVSPSFTIDPSKKYYIYFSSFYSEYSYPLEENHYDLYISNDDGTNWQNAADLMVHYYNWYESTVDLRKYLNGSNSIKFKFVLEKGPLDPSFPVALYSKGIFDDFNIMRSKSALDVNDAGYADIEIGPNPFNNSLTVKLGNLQANNFRNAEIIDVMGNLIYKFNNVSSPEIVWNGENMSGEKVSAGVYLLKLNLDDEVKTYKLVKQ